jgi:hypothetical protein
MTTGRAPARRLERLTEALGVRPIGAGTGDDVVVVDDCVVDVLPPTTIGAPSPHATPTAKPAASKTRVPARRLIDFNS